MEKLLIIGAGGLGRMTLDVAEEFYECFYVDDAYTSGEMVCNTRIVGKISDLRKLYFDYKNAVIAIGNNLLREKIYYELLDIGYIICSIVSKKAFVSKYASVGKGCIILPNSCIQNGAIIGNGVVITSLVEIHHDCQVNNFSLIYSNSTIRTNAIVGRRVKIGSNVSIGNNIVLCDDEIIKDGSTMFI